VAGRARWHARGARLARRLPRPGRHHRRYLAPGDAAVAQGPRRGHRKVSRQGYCARKGDLETPNDSFP
jgi:hypothetical protein